MDWMPVNHHIKIPKWALGAVFTATLVILGAVFALPTNAAPRPVAAQTPNVCLDQVGIPVEDFHWTYIPESPDQLYTEERYFFLAGELIQAGVVDASDCPAGGLMLNGYANACGMSRALETVIVLQNILNEPILQAWDDVGVPPVLLKRLIATESQFWPSRFDPVHYGYGHVTNLGLRNAIQWNPRLRTMVCPPGVDCVESFAAAEQILATLVATCPECEYGIDTEAAFRSVEILAEILLGYCYQTAQLVANATGWRADLAVNYATIWKLTLMNYNSGSQCTYETLLSTFAFTQGPMNWSDISARVTGGCGRGLWYANDITAPYFDFPPAE